MRGTWAAELQAALLKHDPTWRVRKSADIATDVLAAAARIDLDYGVYTVRALEFVCVCSRYHAHDGFSLSAAQ